MTKPAKPVRSPLAEEILKFIRGYKRSTEAKPKTEQTFVKLSHRKANSTCHTTVPLRFMETVRQCW